MLASDGTGGSLKPQELGIKDLASGAPGQCVDSDNMPKAATPSSLLRKQPSSLEDHRPKEVYLTSKTWTQRARHRHGQRDGTARLRLVAKSNPAKLRWSPPLLVSLTESRVSAHRVWPVGAALCPHAIVIADVGAARAVGTEVILRSNLTIRNTLHVGTASGV